MKTCPVEAAIEAMTDDPLDNPLSEEAVWDEKVSASIRELVGEGFIKEELFDDACEVLTNQLEEVLEHAANYRALLWDQERKDEERMRHE